MMQNGMLQDGGWECPNQEYAGGTWATKPLQGLSVAQGKGFSALGVEFGFQIQ